MPLFNGYDRGFGQQSLLTRAAVAFCFLWSFYETNNRTNISEVVKEPTVFTLFNYRGFILMEILSAIALKIFGLFFIIIFLDWPWGNFNCIPVRNWFFFSLWQEFSLCGLNQFRFCPCNFDIFWFTCQMSLSAQPRPGFNSHVNTKIYWNFSDLLYFSFILTVAYDFTLSCIMLIIKNESDLKQIDLLILDMI